MSRNRTSLGGFGVLAVNPASLPSDVTAGDLIDEIATLKGMPIVYFGTGLQYSSDSISVFPVRTTTVPHSPTTALASSLIIKASAGYLVDVAIQNGGTAQYFQLFDSATLPANGVNPVRVIYLAANEHYLWEFKSHRQFQNGIVICNSSTMLTKTIGAADSWFEANIEL